MAPRSESGIQTRKTFCRVCHASCAMEVDVRDGRPLAVRGDREDPIFRGYTCVKGRQLVDLEPGEGQVRGLLCIGGNPVAAWPDQEKTRRAMDALDLLVCVDIQLSGTSKLDILPGKICLEREDSAWLLDLSCEEPYANYTQAVCEPDGELIEEWEFYWEIARRGFSSLRTA